MRRADEAPGQPAEPVPEVTFSPWATDYIWARKGRRTKVQSLSDQQKVGAPDVPAQCAAGDVLSFAALVHSYGQRVRTAVGNGSTHLRDGQASSAPGHPHDLLQATTWFERSLLVRIAAQQVGKPQW